MDEPQSPEGRASGKFSNIVQTISSNSVLRTVTPSPATYKTVRAKLDRQSAQIQRSANELTDEAEEAIRYDTFLRTRSKPWLNEFGECTWSPLRVMVGKALLSRQWECMLLCIIGFNVGLIFYETNEEAKCYPLKTTLEACQTASSNSMFLEIANTSLLIIYSAEVLMSVYTLRREYFQRRAHQFDCIICLGGWFAFALGGLFRISWIRCLRCVRILRTLKFISAIPECYLLFSGFAGSMKAIFFGAIILAALLCLFSIVIVQIIHPINASIEYPDCPHCAQGFQSIGESMLTLFQQIVAGDSWGLISVPVMKESWLGMFLPVTHLVIGVGAMNLILAVVVDRAVEAREQDREHVAQMRGELQKARKLDLLRLVREFDKDDSGTIDREEIMHATEHSIELRQRLLLLGLSTAELGEVFDALKDESFDGSSTGYLKLCTAFDDLQAADIRKTVVFTKLHITHLQTKLQQHFVRQDALLEGMARQLSTLVRTNRDTNERRVSEARSDFGVASQSSNATDADNMNMHHTKSLPRSRISSTVTPLHIADLPCPSSDHSLDSQSANEMTQLRHCLAQLDSSWKHALRIAHKVSRMCLDGGMLESQGANNMHTLCKHVLEKSGQRGSRLVQDLSKDLEDDVAALLGLLTSQTSYDRDSVIIPVDDHQTVCSMPDSLRQPLCPRTPSPFVAWRRWPRTPRAHHDLAGAVEKVNGHSN